MKFFKLGTSIVATILLAAPAMAQDPSQAAALATQNLNWLASDLGVTGVSITQSQFNEFNNDWVFRAVVGAMHVVVLVHFAEPPGNQPPQPIFTVSVKEAPK